jgi:hypothetical protein
MIFGSEGYLANDAVLSNQVLLRYDSALANVIRTPGGLWPEPAAARRSPMLNKQGAARIRPSALRRQMTGQQAGGSDVMTPCDAETEGVCLAGVSM